MLTWHEIYVDGICAPCWNGCALEKAQPEQRGMHKTMFFANVIFALLASDQFQSLGRSALKVGGTLLVAKGGLDPSAVDTIVGFGGLALGLLQSINTHAPATPVK